MKKIINIILALSLLTICGSSNPVYSQTEEYNEVAVGTSNKTVNLELPSDQVVKNDEGFIAVKAECKGDVKWLVISALKIKYFTLPNNTIIVSIPPYNGTITIFAVGLVDGKLTEFARTNITVTDGKNVPDNNNNPNNDGGPYHFTFIVDLNKSTPKLAQVLNSQKINQSIVSNNFYRRVYDIRSPILKEKKMDTIVSQVGGSAVLIVQNSKGNIVYKGVIPDTEDEVIAIINRFGGK